jgi:hypothetical protein
MPVSQQKRQVLQSNAYYYDFDRMIYVNRDRRKVFSYEAVADHDDAWLQRCIQEPSAPDWTIYFNEEPSEVVREDLIRYLSR